MIRSCIDDITLLLSKRQLIAAQSFSEWLLFNTATWHLYDGDNKLIFNELMMRSGLYYTNSLVRYFVIVLAYREYTCRPTRTHYPDSEVIFALFLQCCVFSREATNTPLDLPDQGSNPRSLSLKTRTLIDIPPMRSQYFSSVHDNTSFPSKQIMNFIE